jgi:alpha-1,2-mannosyltransferase
MVAAVKRVPMIDNNGVLKPYGTFLTFYMAVCIWACAWMQRKQVLDRVEIRQQLQEGSPWFLQVMIDTTGWAFINPLCKLAGAKVAAYVHYPTVSTDMLLRVWSQQSTYNNDDTIARSSVKSMIKVLYYEAFAIFYGLVGACAGE